MMKNQFAINKISILIFFVFTHTATIFSQEDTSIYTNAKQEAYIFFKSPIVQSSTSGSFSFSYSDSVPTLG
jgi:hypothetical protein